jgi:hypothetical protein
MSFAFYDEHGYRKGKRVASILSCDIDNDITVIKYDENENEIERKNIISLNFDDEEQYYNKFEDIYGKYQLFKDCDVIESHVVHKGVLLLRFNIEVNYHMFQQYNECETNAVFDLIKKLNDYYKSYFKEDSIMQSI